MKDNQKKEGERWYIECLRREVPDLRLGEILSDERPDFIVRSTDPKLGIEVTRLFKKKRGSGKPMQAFESERRAIVKRAHHLFERNCAVKLKVAVFFSGTDAPSKRVREKIAIQIGDIVRSCMPLDDNSVRVDSQTSELIFPIEVSSIRVTRFGPFIQSIWYVPVAGWVQEDFVEELQDIIDDKAKLFPKYLAKCDRCWLLIIADATGESAFFEGSGETIGHEYHSPFERTYLYETLSQKVFRLLTVEPVSRMKNPFVQQTSEVDRLRNSLREHLAQMCRILQAPDRDTTNAYIFIAGQLRALLCDQYAIMVKYAEIQNHELKIWGPKPKEIIEGHNVLMSVHFLVASYESNPLMREMSIKEYLHTPIGVANWEKYTPSEIIKLVANKEGAAHLDPHQNEKLEAIKSTFVVKASPSGRADDDKHVILRTAVLQIGAWASRSIEDLLALPLDHNNKAGAS